HNKYVAGSAPAARALRPTWPSAVCGPGAKWRVFSNRVLVAERWWATSATSERYMASAERIRSQLAAARKRRFCAPLVSTKSSSIDRRSPSMVMGFRRRAHPFLHSHGSAVSRPARAATRQLAPWGRPPDPNTGRPCVSGFSLRRLRSQRVRRAASFFQVIHPSGVLEAPDDATPGCATPTPFSALDARQVREPAGDRLRKTGWRARHVSGPMTFRVPTPYN